MYTLVDIPYLISTKHEIYKRNTNIFYYWFYFEAYQRWVRTTHERVKYVQRTCGMVDMVLADDFGTQHQDLRSYSISKSKNSVKRTMDPVNCFSNPFAVDASRLEMLASGATKESLKMMF